MAGQKAVASVRLPPPWDKEFVVARVSPLGAGQLLVVNEHNAPYELAGSPLAASTGATQTGAKAGPSVLLGRLTGLAAFSRYTRNLCCSLSTAYPKSAQSLTSRVNRTPTRLLSTEATLLRVSDLTLLSHTPTAIVWPPIQVTHQLHI